MREGGQAEKVTLVPVSMSSRPGSDDDTDVSCTPPGSPDTGTVNVSSSSS